MFEPRPVAGTAALTVLSLGHALLTWPLEATARLFAGGAAIALILELLAVNLGLLEHHVTPAVGGVPVYIVAAWPAVIYPLFRIGLWLAGGISAVLIAAGLATVWDLLTDHHGVAAGQWSYTDSIPGPRFRGVPWWNYAGWALIASITAGLTLPAL